MQRGGVVRVNVIRDEGVVIHIGLSESSGGIIGT